MIIVKCEGDIIVIFTIIQAERKCHRKCLGWELHYALIITVNFYVKFTIIFTVIQMHMYDDAVQKDDFPIVQ